MRVRWGSSAVVDQPASIQRDRRSAPKNGRWPQAGRFGGTSGRDATARQPPTPLITGWAVACALSGYPVGGLPLRRGLLAGHMALRPGSAHMHARRVSNGASPWASPPSNESSSSGRPSLGASRTATSPGVGRRRLARARGRPEPPGVPDPPPRRRRRQQPADRRCPLLSINSVKTYIRSAYRKMDVSSRVASCGLGHPARLPHHAYGPGRFRRRRPLARGLTAGPSPTSGRRDENAWTQSPRSYGGHERGAGPQRRSGTCPGSAGHAKAMRF